MTYWLSAAPLLIQYVLPFVFLALWWRRLRAKSVFVVVSFLAAFGVSFVTALLAGFVLEPVLRSVWDVPRFELLGKNHPLSPYVVGAFHVVCSSALMFGIMSALRRALGHGENAV